MKLIFALGGESSLFYGDTNCDMNSDSLKALIDSMKRHRLDRPSINLEDSIVCLTRSYPPSTQLVTVRRTLTKEFPRLQTALWVVCMDLTNPFIIGAMHKLGEVRDEVSSVPIFIESLSCYYALLMPEQPNMPFLQEQVERIHREVIILNREPVTERGRNLLRERRSRNTPSSCPPKKRTIFPDEPISQVKGRYCMLSEPPSGKAGDH